MKKRFICIFLAAVLFSTVLTACGEKVTENTVRNEPAADYTAGVLLKEKLQVPDSVTGEFTSESGLTRVFVDADITVPEVSRVDIVEAVPRTFTDEEILSFTGRHTESADWKYAVSKEPYTDGLPYVDVSSEGVDFYYLWIDAEEDEIYKSITVDYRLFSNGGELASAPGLEYYGDYNRAYGLDCSMVPLTDGRAAD
ncbi:MAG: hypothetical protein J6I98_01555, partial [Clostridia bacterium]|nr:hypothetical protein [Clostridia bacterium]